MMITANEAGENLILVIGSKNFSAVLSCIAEFRAAMSTPLTGADYVIWISTPSNLSRVQNAITDYLGVPQRAMAIKRALMSRTQRASLLMQAIEIAVSRANQI